MLGWYAANGRDLPWRKTHDPYAILVCEILSHQTQITRVIPVYEELLARYPTVEAMAAAPLEAVTAITDPLGYKIRGRWLHEVALRVRDAGAFPTTIDSLRQLPGVGRYTAGALASFAHGQDEAVVDTNIARLLTRHFALRGARARARARLWQLATELIPRGNGGRFNQAMMDIGALLCRARAPRCEACPLRRSCGHRIRRQASARPPGARLPSKGSPSPRGGL
ncbi:MAG TPA: A/G-specific adenine glycosylase [Candidatus Dormibacteraeota bacterium]|nr:A/G-specific adenine glycosylase [Candidatus Dormibacteraeota bacterium]